MTDEAERDRRRGRGFSKGSSQAKRRDAAVLRQRQKRRNLLSSARSIVLGGAAGGSAANAAAAAEGEEEEGAGAAMDSSAASSFSFASSSPCPSTSTSSSSSAQHQQREVGSSARDARSTRDARVRERRRFWASQVTAPEWMVDAPFGLNGEGSTRGEGWFVRARPEGRRCLVTAYNGQTVARLLDGNVLHRWQSALPFGSAETMQGHGRRGGGGGGGGGGGRGAGAADGLFVVLECIFHAPTETFWVMDGMAWKDLSLYDCTAEFRFYWLYQQLAELPPDARLPSAAAAAAAAATAAAADSSMSLSAAADARGGGFVDRDVPFASMGFGGAEQQEDEGEEGGGSSSSSTIEQRLKVCLAPYYDCTPTGLSEAYQGAVPFIRDGLFFYLKAGLYEPGSSPLVLAWKDARSSRYLVYADTQQAVLAAVAPSSLEERGDDGDGDDDDEEGQEEERGDPAAFGMDEEQKEGIRGRGGTGVAEEEEEEGGDLALVTLEGIRVDTLPAELVKEHGVRHGDLVRISIDGATEVDDDEEEWGTSVTGSAHLAMAVGSAATHATAATTTTTTNPSSGSGRCVLLGPRFDKKCSPNRALADSWSKILFQCRARSGAVQPSAEQILAASQQPTVHQFPAPPPQQQQQQQQQQHEQQQAMPVAAPAAALPPPPSESDADMAMDGGAAAVSMAP